LCESLDFHSGVYGDSSYSHHMRTHNSLNLILKHRGSSQSLYEPTIQLCP